MKILILMGSPRKKHGQNICAFIENQLLKQYDIEFEYVFLNELNIGGCIGCDLCFQKGEQYCPVKDDISTLKENLILADGIIFVSPVYAYQVTGGFKKIIDRLSFLFHRPELIGKPAITIVTTGGGGHKQVAKYLKMVACGWGCNLIEQIEVISIMYFNERGKHSFFNEKYFEKTNKKLCNSAEKLYLAMKDKTLPKPSFYDIYMFNGLRSKTFTSEIDYKFWEGKGWLRATYYYNTKINPFVKIFGVFINKIISVSWSKMQKQL